MLIINAALRERAAQRAVEEWNKRHPGKPVPQRQTAIDDGVISPEEEFDLNEMAAILLLSQRLVVEEAAAPTPTTSPAPVPTAERMCSEHLIANPWLSKYCPHCGGRFSDLRLREAMDYWSRMGARTPF